MRLVYTVTCCVLLVLLFVATQKINRLEEQSRLWQDAHTSLARYWLEREAAWSGERAQWRDVMNSRDEIILWWERKLPDIVEKTVEVPVAVPVEVTREVAVLQYVYEKINPLPFESAVALREWLDGWTVRMSAYGSTIYLDSACENLAYAMMIDAANDGYLAGAQIDPVKQHMMVVVPIYSENRYLFVEPSDKTISKIFMGREWRIN